MSPPLVKQKRGITFAEDTQSSEVTSSQCASSYIDVLSQPAAGLSHRQRLIWMQKRRGPGLWVQCDECDKWRFLPHIVDSHELPDKWYCRMHPDRTESDCSMAEATIRLRDEEDLIHSDYSAGSLVWARLQGWPWWPAMVDDCPDTEQFYWLDGFSDIPTHYNVVFFDSCEVSRAWIAPKDLKPYGPHKKALKKANNRKSDRKRLEAAFKQADDAEMLPLANRLAKYSFVARYRGNIGSPKQISKAELEKFKKKLKRRLDIDFSDESGTESDGSDSQSKGKPSSDKRRKEMRNKNVILVGTPKRAKRMKPNEKNEAPIEIIDVDSPIEDKSSDKPVEPTNVVFKQPDSMTVQIGSTNNETIAIDNDSSKTYLPESEIVRTEDSRTDSEFAEFQVRIASPSSDDFEF